MDDPGDVGVDHLVDHLQYGTDDDRVAAAAALLDRADEDPGAVAARATALVEALKDDREAVRVDVSAALDRVAVHDPVPLLSVVPALVADLDDDVEAVRTNLTGPIGEIATRRPGRVREHLSSLVGHLADPCREVRHGVAWAVEGAATRYPGAVLVHADDIIGQFPDGYDPVNEHLCRALAHVERYRPGTAAPAVPALDVVLDSDRADVRVGATELLGALGTADARSDLLGLAETDPDPDVRRAARSGFRETVVASLPAAPPGQSLGEVGDLSTAVATGEWVGLDADGLAPRGGRYRGEVVSTAADPGVRLYNPYERYWVDLTGADGRIRAAYQDDRRTGVTRAPATDLRRLDGGGDLATLLYAAEGDRLEFVVEGAPHHVTVTEVRVDDDRRILVGENRADGYAVEFRPFGRRPTMVMFTPGRGFDVADLRIDGEVSAPFPAPPTTDPWPGDVDVG